MSRRLLWAVAGLAGGVAVLGAIKIMLSEPRVAALAEIGLAKAKRRLAGTPVVATHSPLRARTPPVLGLWVVDESTKVFPGDDLGPPRPRNGAAPVRLTAARGETVAFQIVLAGAAGATGVDVVPGPLTGAGGALPRGGIQVFLESYIACAAVQAKAVSLGPGEYPDALVPLRDDWTPERRVAAGFGVPANRNQPLWVDVSIPRDAPPGTYTGVLEVASSGASALVVPLEVEVADFEIPLRPALFAWVPLYAGRLERGEKLDVAGERRADVEGRYFLMANAHRIATQIMEDEPGLEWDEATGALLSADWTAYDARNGPALEGRLGDGAPPPAFWKVGGFVWWGAEPGTSPHFGGNYQKDQALTPAHKRALGEYAQEVGRHFREKGWTRSQPFFYMIDEPDLRETPSLAHMIRGYGEALVASGQKMPHLVTIGPEQTTLAHGAVGIWATWGAGYYPRVMRERQALGERTWFYQVHEPFVGGNSLNNEGLAMRTWPWIAWRYKVDGVFLWVGNFWNDDPYRHSANWDDLLLGNGILFYPGAQLPALGFPAVDGPVSSFRMKALRRGQYDYDYLELLRARGGDADAVAARIVRNALNEREYNPYWKHPLWERPGDWSHDPGEWDAARRAVAAEIVKRGAPRSAP